MTKLPSVSVVVPAYRQAAFIDRGLDSVGAQTYGGPVQVLVIDDGCPEASGDVADQHALRPTVLRQPNGGVSQARNTGLKHATGDYVAFLDPDDFWHPDKLHLQIRELQKAGGPALGFTRYQRVTAAGVALSAPGISQGGSRAALPTLVPSLKRLVRSNFIGTSTVVMHRDCLVGLEGFPDDRAMRRGGQDYALWLRVAARHPLVLTDQVLVNYTVHEGSRVGLDPLKNYRGALNALEYFWLEEPAAVRQLGVRPASMVLSRATGLVSDLARERAGVGEWLRAGAAVAEGLLSASSRRRRQTR